MFNVPQGVQSAVTGAGAAVKKGVQAVQQGPVGQAVGQAGQTVSQAATSAGKRASDFLSTIGTSGGAIGAVGLSSFGAGAITGALVSGRQREQDKRRMAGDAIQIGSPHVQGASMPQDLQAGYVNLNTFGSPLPMYGLMGAHNVHAAQMIQDQGTAYQQRLMSTYMPQTGQLPIGAMPQQPQQKGRR